MKQPKGWAKWSPFVVRGLRWVVPASATAAVVFVVVQAPFTTASRPVPVEVSSVPVSTVLSVPASMAAHDVAAAIPSQAVVTAPSAAVAANEPERVQPGVFLGAGKAKAWGATVSPFSAFAEFASVVAQSDERTELRDERRLRSSWSSRYSTLAQEIGAPVPERTTQLVAFSSQDDPSKPGDRAFAGPALAVNARAGRAPDERMLRSLEERLGSSGSRGLSIRF